MTDAATALQDVWIRTVLAALANDRLCREGPLRLADSVTREFARRQREGFPAFAERMANEADASSVLAHLEDDRVGMPIEVASMVWSSVQAGMDNSGRYSNKIQAIKLYRDRVPGSGLKEAKDAVEAEFTYQEQRKRRGAISEVDDILGGRAAMANEVYRGPTA